MDNFLIINFNERMEFQVYKYKSYSYDNIYDEMIDESVFVSVELGFQKSWMETYGWFFVQKVQG